MNSYLKLIGRENLIFLVILSVIFFATYWTNQLGLKEFFILILPQINSIFQIFIFSIIFLIGIPLLNTYAYYLEITYFTKINYKSAGSKRIVLALRSITALIIYFSPTLSLLLILTFGFYIEKN